MILTAENADDAEVGAKAPAETPEDLFVARRQHWPLQNAQELPEVRFGRQEAIRRLGGILRPTRIERLGNGPVSASSAFSAVEKEPS
jgi:hypothetical protein